MSDIQGYMEELSPLLQKESRAIIDDSVTLHAIERLFQLVVDGAIDINTHVINEGNFHVPEDYESTFRILAQNNVIPGDFALKIAPSVGLRNQVVHKYGKVDLKYMVDQIKGEIGDYNEYLKHMNEFLNKHN